MKIRELLQTEIWSKRTSRKILVVFGVVVVGCAVWVALNRYWITPAERNSGRAALIEIDVLQNFRGMSDAEYDAGVRKAKAKVETAERAVWTFRDEKIATALSGYLSLTELEKSSQKTNFRSTSAEQKHLDESLLQSLGMARSFLRQTLHQVLK